jgi:hypothetical protein
MWGAALRRLTGLFVLASGGTVLISLSFALLLGESVSRAVSVGFYLVGSFLTIAGFFVGNRGPVRLKRDVGVPLLGSRFVRWATPEEREESINTSAIYVVLGFALIFLGVLADTRYSLV